MKRRRRKNCALCAVGAVLAVIGAVWLCVLSYRFLLIFAAAALIIIGLLLRRNC